MILSAQAIRRFAENEFLVSPFCERGVVRGRSFGLSSCGYDVRVDFGFDEKFGTAVIFSDPDPGNFCHEKLINSKFKLAATFEHFNMPDNVMGVVHDKSSWARQGLSVQNTIIEPGWRGFLTLELAYHGGGELVITQGDPIAQIIFHWLDHPTEQPYGGKYQDQERGPQPAREEKV